MGIHNIRKDLIKEELRRDGFKYKKRQLNDKFLNWLFRSYYCLEMVENLYDDEPDVEDELFNMYLDYQEEFRMTPMTFWNVISRQDELKENKRFSKEEHTQEELKEAYEKVTKMIDEHKEERMSNCTWQDLYAKRIWGMSKKQVNQAATDALKTFKRVHEDLTDRVYVGTREDLPDQLRIYLYGRDNPANCGTDYWFIFVKKLRTKRKEHEKELEKLGNKPAIEADIQRLLKKFGKHNN